MNNSTVEPFRSKQLVILFMVNFVIILQLSLMLRSKELVIMFIDNCNNSTVKPNVKVKVTSDYVYN